LGFTGLLKNSQFIPVLKGRGFSRAVSRNQWRLQPLRAMPDAEKNFSAMFLSPEETEVQFPR